MHPAAHRASDVQVELVMLDPYVRTTLSHDGAGRFSTQVGAAPDSWARSRLPRGGQPWLAGEQCAGQQLGADWPPRPQAPA